MTSHFAFVTGAYVVSVLVLAGLMGFIVRDWRAKRRELAALEDKGIRRRSEGKDAKPS